jgi:hypothetical protein
VAGISSALGWVAIAKQSAKGTPAGAPTIKLKLSAAPSIAPIKERGRYEVTDIGRDAGPGYTSRLAVGGSFQCYMEPAAMALLWYLVLGANADAGAGPYTHTATPANDLPYCTIWRSVGGVLTERFVDCKIGSVSIEGTSGNPFAVSIAFDGLSATYGDATGDALAALEPAGYLFPELFAALKFDTVAQKCHALRFGIANNLSPHQSDDYFNDDVDPGKREVTLGVDFRFTGPTAFPDYKTLLYGAGTALVPAVSTHAFQVILTRSAGLKQQIDLPQVTYTPWSPQPDPAGTPIEAGLACEVEKPAAGVIATIVSTDAATTV